MNSNPWDREVEILNDEITTLKGITRRLTRSDKAPLIAKKATIVQSRINLSGALERIVAWAKRGYTLGPKDQTLVHWSSVYAGRVQKFNEERTRLWSRMLWVRLIQARVGGRGLSGSRSSSVMETDELVGLAVRYAGLSETEKQLEQALIGLRERQSDLLVRHSRLGIADANRDASGSLQARLGINFDDAMRSAPSRALSDFVDQLSAPVHHDHDDDEWMSKVRSEFSANTQTVLEQCRWMVLSMLGSKRSGESEVNGRSTKHLNEAIKRLESLEQVSVRAENHVQRAPLKAAKPKLVQNRRIQAKK